MYDLVLKGGRVVDPSEGLDDILDIAIAGSTIAKVAAGIPEAEAAKVVDVSGKLVTPGLIDFHAHVFWGMTNGGLEADKYFLSRGVTTVVDGGSSGAVTFPGFKRWIVDASRTRIYCFLNLACIGLTGNRKAGELANLTYADPEGAEKIFRQHPDVALGVKVRLSKEIVGGSCLPALKMARELCDRAGVPMTIHIGNTVEPLYEIVQWLKAGDIVAHFMTGRENGSLDNSGRLFPQIKEARERGVLFDVAPGSRSHFASRSAEQLLSQGFLPDALGTDLTTNQIKGIMTDVPLLMSRFMMLGMSLSEVVRLTTSQAAKLLGKADQFGSLKPGLAADVAVLQWEDTEIPIVDLLGDTRVLRRQLVPVATVRGGQLV